LPFSLAASLAPRPREREAAPAIGKIASGLFSD
jgi:hypothetical protein